MLWFRSHSKWVSSLALLALLGQLTLAFGHVHRKDFGSRTFFEIPVAADARVLPSPDAQYTDALPEGGEGPAHAVDYCAFCAIAGLLNVSQVAAPPALLPPFLDEGARIFRGLGARLAEFRFVLGQARAPPIT
jgi:hypothetical protein